jgi:hypothetical protein
MVRILFKPWDDYAIRILLKNEDAFEPVAHGGVTCAWTLPEYEYSALKLFALSVLWRAHTSIRPEFGRVQLGPHEPKIRGFLLNDYPGAPEESSVHICRWIDDDFGPVFMDPFHEAYEGVNYYRIYCGRYVFYVKVDLKPTCDTFRETQLGQTKQLFVIARELKKSKEWYLMQKLAREHEN